MLPRASFSAGEASLSMRSACPGCVAITTASKFSAAQRGAHFDAFRMAAHGGDGLASRTSGSVAASLST